MESDVLTAISNLVKFKETDLSSYDTTYQIGINSVGERIEFYIKDALANTFNVVGKNAKEIKYNQIFSSLGNQNNPPDIIIKNSDAYEIKKSSSPSSTIALNSSRARIPIWFEAFSRALLAKGQKKGSLSTS